MKNILEKIKHIHVKIVLLRLVCLAAILGGAIGNLIDRIATGRVVDMICLDFIRFPVFNVADCFITCGCLALVVYILFSGRSKKIDEAEG